MYITILQLYNFLSIDTKQQLLKLLNNDLDLIRRQHNISFQDWLEIVEEKDMSVRLRNCLYFGRKDEDLKEKSINDIDKEDIISIRNAGEKCWIEFEKLRQEYNESIKK